MAVSIEKLLQQVKIAIPSGASFTGDLQERIRNLLSFTEGLSHAAVATLPGSYTRVGDDETASLTLAAPIAYDVWYLFHTDSVLPIDDEDEAERRLEALSLFFEDLQDIKPLRTLRNKNDLKKHFSVAELESYFTNNGPYMIKEMRFEVASLGQSHQHPSGGYSAETYPIYLAFPVGHLGVMEVLSLIRETEEIEFDNTTAIVPGGSMMRGMMPPVSEYQNACIGEHLVESAYIVKGDIVEYLAEDFQGYENPECHQWLRYWISSDQTWPVPGEFIALLCKSWPYHVWWFQETFPFVYSGNWFETEYYTSGVITEVIEPSNGEEVTNIYKVNVRQMKLCLRPTDFCEYKVDDRVAVLKQPGASSDAFDWTEFIQKEDSDDIDSDWVIAPISFYGET